MNNKKFITFGIEEISKMNLYGWDCSSLLLFNIDVIEKQNKIIFQK